MYDSHQEKAKLLILWAGNLWKVSASFSVQCQLIKGLVVSAFKMFEKPLLILIFFLNAPGKCIWRSVWKGQYEPNTTDSIWYTVSKLLFFIWWLRQAGNQRESMGNIFCILVVLFFFLYWIFFTSSQCQLLFKQIPQWQIAAPWSICKAFIVGRACTWEAMGA